MNDQPASILIVEDDDDHRRLLNNILRSDGYKVTACATVANGLAAIRDAPRPFDVALLDLYVGSENGMAVAIALRVDSPYTGIVVLTGKGGLQTALQSIDLQIQKYLLKPARPDELRRVVAELIPAMRERRLRDRLAAHMRAAIETYDEASGQSASPAMLISGPLHMDLGQYRANLDGRELSLTTTEFYLLWVLAKAAGKPVKPHDLAQAALDYQVSDVEAAGLIKSHMSRLRKKVEPDPRRPRHIITIRRAGYLWRP